MHHQKNHSQLQQSYSSSELFEPILLTINHQKTYIERYDVIESNIFIAQEACQTIQLIFLAGSYVWYPQN